MHPAAAAAPALGPAPGRPNRSDRKIQVQYLFIQALAAWGSPLSDLPGLVPPALPWWAMPLVLWRTCPRVTYFPPFLTGLALSLPTLGGP